MKQNHAQNINETAGNLVGGSSLIARGPFGGKYDVMEFFPCMDTDWEKASRCLQPLLPHWLRQAMYGKVLSRNNIEIVQQYTELAEVQRHVSGPLASSLNELLNENSRATVSAAYCKVKVKGIISFGVMINVSQTQTIGTPFHRHFEGFVNLQDRTKWDIMDLPDANDRTINDPAWLIPSNRTRQNGLTELPMAMRLDMLGQFYLENGWTNYKVYGQQLLLTVELVIKKGQ